MLFLVKSNLGILTLNIKRGQSNFSIVYFCQLQRKRLLSCRFATTAQFWLPLVRWAQPPLCKVGYAALATNRLSLMKDINRWNKLLGCYSVTNSALATQRLVFANHKTSSEQKNWSSFISDQSQMRVKSDWKLIDTTRIINWECDTSIFGQIVFIFTTEKAGKYLLNGGLEVFCKYITNNMWLYCWRLHFVC